MSQRPAIGLYARRRKPASLRERLTGALPPLKKTHAEIWKERAHATGSLCRSRGPGMCICRFETDHAYLAHDSSHLQHECTCGQTWPEVAGVKYTVIKK